MNKKNPGRKDVWLVNFDPSVGSEIKKTRPAVVVSNDESNKFLERVQVLPFTSNTEKVYPCECVVQTNKVSGKIAADQIMTVSKKRLYKHVDVLSDIDMIEIERIIKIQLNLQ